MPIRRTKVIFNTLLLNVLNTIAKENKKPKINHAKTTKKNRIQRSTDSSTDVRERMRNYVRKP